MFHAINSWLACLISRVREFRVERDHAIASANGWQVHKVASTTYRYRDPRFEDRLEDRREAADLEARKASVRRTQEAWWL